MLVNFKFCFVTLGKRGYYRGICMFFQSKEMVVEISLYDQLKTITTSLLNYELPNASARHHILYTANEKLQSLRETKELHFKESNMGYAIGRFHKNAYEHTLRAYNQLQLIIDGYMELNMENAREHVNHRLRFQSEVIKYCYHQLIYIEKLLDSNSREGFFTALKEDILPVLADLTQ